MKTKIILLVTTLLITACSPLRPATVPETPWPTPTWTPMTISTRAPVPTLTPPDPNGLTPLARTTFDRGMTSLNAGHHQAAIQLLTQAQDVQVETSQEIQRALAESHAALGRHDLAAANYNRSIKVNDNPRDRARRAWSRAQDNRCPHATKDAQHVLDLNPHREEEFHSHVTARMALALCQQRDGKTQEARSNIEQALRTTLENGIPNGELEEMSQRLEEEMR